MLSSIKPVLRKQSSSIQDSNGKLFFSKLSYDDKQDTKKRYKLLRKLLRAVVKQNVSGVSKCLQKIDSMDILNKNVQLILQESSRKISCEIFKLLFTFDGLFQFCDQHRMATEISFLLVLASSHGSELIVKYLLDKKALVNGVKPQYGIPTRVTPLLMASMNGHESIVSLLLEHGADVHLGRTTKGDFALGIASANGHLKCVSSLLSANANPMLKNRDGLNAIELAKDHPHVLCVLLHHRNPVVVRKLGDVPSIRREVDAIKMRLQANYRQ